MPVVISSLHSKGGVGKSTIALFLAGALREEGSSVLVLDTDAQGTASAWSRAQENRDGALVVATPSVAKLESELDQLGASYDVVVIDGSAQLKGSTGAVIRLSDLVLIPIQPSPADIWATENIVSLVEERRAAVGEPAAGFVLNRAVAGTNLADDVTDVLEDMGLPVIATLHQRVAFAEALITGETPLSYDPKGKAAAETRALREAVLDTLSNHYQTRNA